MEKEIEDKLCVNIKSNPDDILVETSKAKFSFEKLIKNSKFTIFQDNSDWNKDKSFMTDVIGGMTPDIVLRSDKSGENRIYIEVKESSHLNYGKEDSQIVRYFLHLLAASSKNTTDNDLHRAILLAAPICWFEQKDNKIVWEYFLNTFSGLANAFDIVVGRIII